MTKKQSGKLVQKPSTGYRTPQRDCGDLVIANVMKQLKSLFSTGKEPKFQLPPRDEKTSSMFIKIKPINYASISSKKSMPSLTSFLSEMSTWNDF
jgi:hypothetical protein